MIELIYYTSNHKIVWDELVATSKNGTFLFYRDYLEYHLEIYYRRIDRSNKI